MPNQIFSDEYLNAFVDNQLESAEKIQAFDTIQHNQEFKDRVCELSGLKEMMQHAYKISANHTRTSIKPRRPWNIHMQALAACLLLLLGGVSGWLTHAWSDIDVNNELKNIAHAPQQIESSEDIRKVVVHVGNSNPMKLKAALDETEELLETYKLTNRHIEVEVIANRKGIDLFRTNLTKYGKRISTMQGKYPNLKFLVCGQTMHKLQDKGESVTLLPHTGILPSAAAQINKRLEQGWGYVRM